MFRVNALLLPMLAGLLLPLAACREGGAPCRRPPPGEVNVFVVGESGKSEFTGTVVSRAAPDEAGLWTYRIQDSKGGMRILRYGAAGDSLPVETGAIYDFRLTTVPGEPTPNSILVLEDGRFLFAGASDYRPGERVFTTAPSDFEIRLVPGDCDDRDVNPCFDSEINGQLVVSRAGQSARLFHGETAPVDGVQVTCLTARLLEYSDRCADAGAFGVSYTMCRSPGPAGSKGSP